MATKPLPSPGGGEARRGTQHGCPKGCGSTCTPSGGVRRLSPARLVSNPSRRCCAVRVTCCLVGWRDLQQ